jgi:hypothetical protein
MKREMPRPFWRDWVFAAAFFAAGFMFSGPIAPFHGWPGDAMLGIGAAIFVAAIAHGLWTLISGMKK